MIRKQSNDNYTFQRQSYVFYSEQLNLNNPLREKWAKYQRNLYPHMFLEDIANRIAPYSYFNIKIIGENYDERMMSEGISPDRYHHTIADAIRSFIHMYSATLIIHHKIHFEIIYFYNQENMEVNKFNIAFIPSLSVIRRHGKVLQEIPTEIASQYNIPNIIELDPQNIIEITLPEKLRTMLKSTLSSLDKVGNSDDFLGAIQKDTLNGSMPNLQNFKEIRDAQELALADAVREVGWNVRYMLDNKITNFYYCIRYLRFMRMIVEIRNSIKEQLNQSFLSIGAKLNFSAQFAIENDTTLQDIAEIEKRLFDGTVSFKDVLKLR